MRVSYQWLKSYVGCDLSPQELADALTMAGVAVDTVQYLGENIEKVITGQITKIEKHPDADKLVVCQITTDGENNIQIVTGAPNVREGNKVPVAMVGAKLPNGVHIKKSKLRGIPSNGMLCSGQELGIDGKFLAEDLQHGILILPEDAPLNMDIKEYLHLNDYVLELDLTPNRGDCLSMIGVAREVSVLQDKELSLPQISLQESSEAVSSLAKIDIQNEELCGRYAARVIKGVKIGPSPEWMQERLRAADIRPINNIVDVTNYVMLEKGQPLHAFDYDKLTNHHIIVRRATDGEKMVTLDDEERQLNENMLVIADDLGPVAIAGVMGGARSEVTAETTNVLIESAFFNPVSIRRTAKALALRSESSARYEKTVDIGNCIQVVDRTAQLMQELAGGEVAQGVIDVYPHPVTEKTISLRISRVEEVIGIKIDSEEIQRILTRLQFKVQPQETELLVTVPTFRPDVSIEVDLIEEVARIYGYNKIPDTMIAGTSTQGKHTARQKLERKIKDLLVASGLTEVVTYGFVSPKVSDLMNLPTDSKFRKTMVLQNPLSEEQSVMRTVLVPNLLEVLQRNHNRQVQSGAIFEMGKVFYMQEENQLPDERPVLAVTLSGKTAKSWNSQAEEMDFFYLKGIVENLLNKLGTKEVSFEKYADPSFHPGRTAAIKIDGTMVGVMGELHPNVLENYQLPNRVVACKIDLKDLMSTELQKPCYKPLPKFPAVERDLAILVQQDVPTQKIIDVINSCAGKILKNIQVFDVYCGAQVPEGFKSQAFSLYFQAADHTLIDEEVSKQTDKIFKHLQKEFNAELRS